MALHVYPAEGLGELACLYVHPSHENRGIGQKMMQFVEAQARKRGLHRLLALSTQAFNFFGDQGGLRRRDAGRPAPVETDPLRPGWEALEGPGQEPRRAAALPLSADHSRIEPNERNEPPEAEWVGCLLAQHALAHPQDAKQHTYESFEIANNAYMDFKRIEPGTFVMGSQDQKRQESDGPRTR